MQLLHYREYGAGAPVMLLHGLFGAGDNLATLARALGENFSVFSLDLRNHGNSFWHDSMSYADMANDVVNFMQSRSISTARLVGHSMGGKVAMQLALNHPDLVERLVVADIAPVNYPPHHSAILAALRAVLAASVTSRSEAGEILARHIEDPAVCGFLLKSLHKNVTGTLGWKFNLQAIEHNYPQLMMGQQGKAYTGPCLFIKGELSDYLSADYREQVSRAFPAARLQVISGTGHWLHAEKPAVFNALVRRFLQS